MCQIQRKLWLVSCLCTVHKLEACQPIERRPCLLWKELIDFTFETIATVLPWGILIKPNVKPLNKSGTKLFFREYFGSHFTIGIKLANVDNQQDNVQTQKLCLNF